MVELLHDLEQEMLRLGYTKGSMQFYRKRWHMLVEFAKEHNENYFTEQLGIALIEKHFKILEKDFEKTLSHTDMHELRVIRIIGDFQLHRTILRRYYNNKKILVDPTFIAISNRFKSYCEVKGCAEVTIKYYVSQSERFMDYLISHKITCCREITLSLINDYIKTLAGYAYKTIEQNIYSIRIFLRFLLSIQEIETDLAAKTPMLQARKQTCIPSVWTKDELKRLIEVIDRGSPQGKRDYAIILLACCLGMRCTDIKNLRFDNFHWEDKKLIFTQSKTKTPISLPLTAEVGWAVIDYLKYGRPKADSPYIFIRHLAPFEAFAKKNTLMQLIKRYMALAHIPTLKKKRGMHSLRHTMASRLLEKETPLSVISDILGHIDPDSTAIYLKVDIQKLKECALSFEEENHHEKD